MGFDITNRQTFDECDKWIKMAKEIAPTACMFAVGNKVDLFAERRVGREEAQGYFMEKKMPYYETSARTGEGVDELFEAITAELFGPSNENV